LRPLRDALRLGPNGLFVVFGFLFGGSSLFSHGGFYFWKVHHYLAHAHTLYETFRSEILFELVVRHLHRCARFVLIHENVTRPSLFAGDLELVLVSVKVRAQVWVADLNLVAKLLRIKFDPSTLVLVLLRR